MVLLSDRSHGAPRGSWFLEAGFGHWYSGHHETFPDLDVAERIGTAIVEEGLAACANLLPGVRSIYRWKGAVERADEIVLLLKTTPSRFDALEARVRELHPHETPCVVALPINRGSAPYLDWIVDETSP